MNKYIVIASVIGNFIITSTSYSYSTSGYMECEEVNKLIYEKNSEFKK